MKTLVSRRSFLGMGALAAAGTTLMGLSGCAPHTQNAVNQELEEAQSYPDWLGAPQQISEDDVVSTVTADVVVVGGGNGGMFAAASAAEEGASVALLEKSGELGVNCREWIGAVGSKLQADAGVEIDKHEIVETLCMYASHRCDQRLIRLWADNSGETVDWLNEVVRSHDPNAYVFLETDIGEGSHGIYKTFAIQHNVQSDEERLRSLDFVAAEIDKLGVDVHLHTTMLQLEQDDSGRVTGLFASTPDGIVKFQATKGVILATGGYCGNREMMESLNKMAVDHCVALQSPGPSNVGDGIKAALWVGAAKDEQPTAMVFDRGGIPAGMKGGCAFDGRGFMTHIGSQPFLKVNKDGERFCNESTPYDFIYAAGTLERDGVYCQIWDANWLDHVAQFHTLACSRIIPSPTGGKAQIFTPEAEIGMIEGVLKPAGVVVEADTLEELAEKLQIPVDPFVKTVERYNELCAKGDDEDFGKEASRMIALDTPPYQAATIGGQLLCTLDGLRVNTDLQVLDQDHDPIPGLYAVGNDSGGFFANNYPELLPGVACGRTITFGRLAGKTVAHL